MFCLVQILNKTQILPKEQNQIFMEKTPETYPECLTSFRLKFTANEYTVNSLQTTLSIIYKENETTN